MANLRTAMDSAFWDLNIASPHTLLGGSAKHIPGDPFPLDGTRSSRVIRIQQLAVLRRGFPFGLVPSYSAPSTEELGPWSLQNLFGRQKLRKGWLGIVAQIRPEKLISAIKAEVNGAKLEWGPDPYKAAATNVAVAKNVARHFLDKSLYSLGLCYEKNLTYSSEFLLSVEAHGERKGRRTKAMLLKQLWKHDLTVEAGWPELYVDRDGKYWDVPKSISLDCSSVQSKSGLRYRFGLIKNSGHPEAVNSSHSEVPVPLALLPGLCAKAAFSYEKNKDFWRIRERKKDLLVETKRGLKGRPAYDVRLKEPHAAISGIIGGTCAVWLRRSGESISVDAKKRSPVSADLFGSVCCSVQHGTFRKPFGDLTRLDARLDFCSASALAGRISKIFRSPSLTNAENPLSSPRLNLIFQQQVAGPILFRVDSKFSLGSLSGHRGLHMEDFIYSLNYSHRLLRSGKVVAWYSPKRKEGMVELRVFEF